MTSLATTDLHTLERLGARISPTALVLERSLAFEEYEELAWWIALMQNSTTWWLADLLNQVETRTPELVAQVALATGHAEQTIINHMSVARRVPPNRRVDTLKFSHHAEVAALEPAEQKEWLRVADDERLTKSELRARIRDEGPDIQREVCPTCQRPL